MEPSADSLVNENRSLRDKLNRLQAHVLNLRDEIRDANAEIHALQRLSEDQKALLLMELDNERAKRLRAEGEVDVLKQNLLLAKRQRPPTTDAATNTVSVQDASVSASSSDAMDVIRGDEGVVGGTPTPWWMQLPVMDVSNVARSSPLALTPNASLVHRVQSRNPAHMQPAWDPLSEFAAVLSRAAGLPSSVDLAHIFRALGGVNVEDVCANITESDLTLSGIPPLKARAVMALVARKTAELLHSSAWR